jgi:hypothetical protein
MVQEHGDDEKGPLMALVDQLNLEGEAPPANMVLAGAVKQNVLQGESLPGHLHRAGVLDVEPQ